MSTLTRSLFSYLHSSDFLLLLLFRKIHLSRGSSLATMASNTVYIILKNPHQHEKQSNLKLDYQDLAIKNVPTQKQTILSSSNCNKPNSSHHNTHYHRSNHYAQRCILMIFRSVKIYIKCFHISCKLFDKNIQDGTKDQLISKATCQAVNLAIDCFKNMHTWERR